MADRRTPLNAAAAPAITNVKSEEELSPTGKNFDGFSPDQAVKVKEEAAVNDELMENVAPSGRRNGDKDELVLQAKREFHNGRCLQVKYLPQDATEEDLKIMLQDVLDISEIQINRRTNTAKVIVEHPEILEEWSEETLPLLQQTVNVSPSLNENILCAAHLPFIYSEEDFRNLAQMYGPLARCFLMKSEISGHSKGYGFIEYTTKEVAHQARNLLHCKNIGNCTLRCDWLDPSCVTYESLHSKCLYVDHLPSNFRDVNELRTIFSVVIKPVYCQIVTKNGNSMGVGLVEYASHEKAEETQQKLNGYQLDNHKIRVSFCIPGIHAITLLNKFTAEGGSHDKKPLLPDPVVNPALLNQLQVLAMQNPQFFQNLQNMVSSQLQNLQNNNQVHLTYQNKKSKGATGLLGSPPSLNSNPNVQAAALLLLAMQTQMRLQQPSLLGNPFLVSQLQNLIKHDNARMGLLGNASIMNGDLQMLLNQLGINKASLQESMNNLPLLSPTGIPISDKDKSFRQNLSDVGDASGVDVVANGRNSLQLNNNHIHQNSMQGNKKTALLPSPNGFGNSKGLLPTPIEPFSKQSPLPWSPIPDRHSNSATSLLDSPSLAFPNVGTFNDHPHSTHNAKPVSSLNRNGSSYSKIPLLGDKPKHFQGLQNRTSLLGEKPANVIGTNVSQLSGFSSFGGETGNDGFIPQSSLLPSDLSGLKKNFPSCTMNGGLEFDDSHSLSNDSLQNKSLQSLYELRNRQQTMGSPMMNPLLPSPGATGGLNYNRNTSRSSDSVSPNMNQGIDAANLSQLNNQLEKLGSNPLINLLLQAAQTNNGLSPPNYDRQESPNGMYGEQRNYMSRNDIQLPSDEFFQGSHGYSGSSSRSNLYSSPSPKRSLLGMPPMSQHNTNESTYSSCEIRNNSKNSLLGDYPGALPVRYSSSRKPPPIHSPAMGMKRKFYNLLPSPEDSPEGHYVGQHSQGLGGHYADSYHKKFKK